MGELFASSQSNLDVFNQLGIIKLVYQVHYHKTTITATKTHFFRFKRVFEKFEFIYYQNRENIIFFCCVARVRFFLYNNDFKPHFFKIIY